MSTAQQEPVGLPWWNSVHFSQSGTSLERMLIEFALSTGRTVTTSSYRGVLMDPSTRGRKELVDEAVKLFDGHLVYEKEPLDAGIIERWVTWNGGALTLRFDEEHRVDTFITTMAADAVSQLKELHEDLVLPAAARQPIYALAEVGSDITAIEVGLVGEPLARENYNDDALSDFDLIVSELDKVKPKGRLVILQGDPGSGKSYYVRGLIEAILDCAFLLVPAHMVDSLDSPRLIPTLVKIRAQMGSGKPIILILEDSDRCLVPRAEGSMGAISSLLNLSDGILGHALNLRVICTTNADVDQIDPALMRARRLLCRTHIGDLTPERAMEAYAKITGSDDVQFSTPIALAEVYAYADNPELLDQDDEEEEGGDEQEEYDDEGEDEDDNEDDGPLEEASP